MIAPTPRFTAADARPSHFWPSTRIGRPPHTNAAKPPDHTVTTVNAVAFTAPVITDPLMSYSLKGG